MTNIMHEGSLWKKSWKAGKEVARWGVRGENWVLSIFRTILDYCSGDKSWLLQQNYFQTITPVTKHLIFCTGKNGKLSFLKHYTWYTCRKMMIDVLWPLLCTWCAQWTEWPPKVMKQSQRWNTLQLFRDAHAEVQTQAIEICGPMHYQLHHRDAHTCCKRITKVNNNWPKSLR